MDIQSNNISYRTGDIFTSSCKFLVNPVNCVGVMGAGLAYQFRKRYPGMFLKYQDICSRGLLRPGKLWIDRESGVLCFPTKYDWRNPSKIEYIIDGLKKFSDTWKEKGITSIAFPILGSGCGGLKKEDVLKVMISVLSGISNEIPVEIWEK